MLEVDLVDEMEVPDLGSLEFGVVEAYLLSEVGLEESGVLHPPIEDADVHVEARFFDLPALEGGVMEGCICEIGTRL